MNRTEIITELENIDAVISKILMDEFLDEETELNSAIYNELDTVSARRQIT